MTKQSASSLVEVLVAVSIIALVLTAVSSMIFMSVKLSESNEKRQLALQKGEESLEYFRKERFVNSWGIFAGSMDDQSTYCLTSFPSSIASMSAFEGSCDIEDVLDVASYQFYREATVDILGSDNLKITVDMTWDGGNENKTLSLEQEFERY